MDGVKAKRTIPVVPFAVLAAVALTVSACTVGDDGGSDGAGDTSSSADPSSIEEAPYAPGGSDAPSDVRVSGNVDTFVTTATAAGWSCIPGADPFTGKPGATCNPGAADVLTKAVFAVFDRADVSDGAQAVDLARQTTSGELGGNTGAAGGAAPDPDSDVLSDQYLPLDSDTLAGYCVNTMGTCGGSGFDGLGLTLG